MNLNPITREEKFLAKAGGEDVGELKPITRREKFLDRIAGGGGADLLETVGGDTLTWDGNTEGLVGVNADGIDLYFKVSESTPTAEEFKNGVSTICRMNDGSEVKESLTEQTILVDDSISSMTFLYSLSLNGAPSVVCIYEDNVEIDGMVFSEKGLYLFGIQEMDELMFVSSLTINGYTGFTKTVLKEEYLPMDKIIALVKASL